MARIIGIVSGKGGVGKTTLASNLALSFKQFGKNVTLIDCNLTTPHLNLYLGSPDYGLSLNDVLRGDATILSACYYHDGVLFVPASNEINDIVGIDPMVLKDSLTELQEATDIVILDSAPSLGKEALSVLAASDEIIFITAPFIPAVNDIVRCNKIIKKFNIKPLGIVLNMVRNKKSEMVSKEVETIAGLPVIGEIPFDENILNALAEGRSVLSYKQDSPASIEYKKLGAKLLGIDFKEHRPKKMFFSKFYNGLRRIIGRPSSSVDISPKQGIIETIQQAQPVTTDADRILNLIRTERSIKIDELSKKANLSSEVVIKWGKFLEERGLVKYQKSLFGGDRLMIKNE